MTYLYWLLLLWAAFLFGFISHAWISSRIREYSGTIVVSMDERREKIVYSLVLDDYPEQLEFHTEVVFKVDTSGLSSDRE